MFPRICRSVTILVGKTTPQRRATNDAQSRQNSYPFVFTKSTLGELFVHVLSLDQAHTLRMEKEQVQDLCEWVLADDCSVHDRSVDGKSTHNPELRQLVLVKPTSNMSRIVF
jgi:hypothetical protein